MVGTNRSELSLTHLFQGITLLHQAEQKAGADAEDLIARAVGQFQAALKIRPGLEDALLNWAHALVLLAKLKSGAESDRLFAQAFAKLQILLDMNPGNTAAL